ncbi:MAG: hypothetical protein COB53_08200 [Elusimicrobia bacterium]|nr:MAG: hypothetical protein COB53_08200 [Elusimicrobiota bacterium]
MKRTFITALAFLVCAVGTAGAERYHVKDEGGFGYTGRRIEFANRYGWKSYKVDYKLDVDTTKRRLNRRSVMKVEITRKDGSTWKYKCKAKHDAMMWANVNKLYGKGISILTECRIPPRKFAKAVGLDADLVGDPTLVFHVMVKGSEARVGVHKGFYFMEAGQIEASTMRQYATRHGDPSELGVLFASRRAPFRNHPNFAMTPRFLP